MELFTAILARASPCHQRVLFDHNARCDRRAVIYGHKVRTHVQPPVTVYAVLEIGSVSTWQGLVL